MQLNIKRVPVTIPDDQVANIVMDYFTGSGTAPAIIPTGQLQPIGAVWPGQGGIFTGLMRGRDDQPDYLLITGPEIDEHPWQQAMDAAEQIEVDGHRDYTLPYRAEQALQYANIPEAFVKEWYWSREQHAADADCAWVQGFSNGSQFSDLKDGRSRCMNDFIVRVNGSKLN